MILGLLVTSVLVALPLFAASMRHVVVRLGRPRRLAGRFAVRTPRTGGGFGIAAAEELHAYFNGNKRVLIEHREQQLVLPDDDHSSAAPPRTGVDLERGTAVLRVPPK